MLFYHTDTYIIDIMGKSFHECEHVGQVSHEAFSNKTAS